MPKVRLAQGTDGPFYYQHLMRHGSESGNDGDLIFAPFDEPWKDSEEKLIMDTSLKWSKPPKEIGWERCWVLTDNHGIYGALKLVHQIPVKTSLHRATLMMGLERSHRKQGFGFKLISEALAWARLQGSMEWIDLYVFSHNQPARSLYEKFGFQETGRVADLFRVRGQKIEDIHMCLNLLV